MAYQDKPGYGAMFINTKGQGNQPNAKGTICVHRDLKAGEVVEIAAWTKVSKKGERYQSLKMSDQRERREPQGEPEPEPDGDPFSDDIPWR